MLFLQFVLFQFESQSEIERYKLKLKYHNDPEILDRLVWAICADLGQTASSPRSILIDPGQTAPEKAV